MNRSFLSSFVVAGALALGAGTASAASMLSTDAIVLHQCMSAASPPTPCNGIGGSPAVASSVLDLVLADGYVPETSITAAQLTISRADDFGAGDGSEKIGVFAGGVSYVTHADANHDVVITLTDFTEVFEAGQLTVQLSAYGGDFFLNGVTLEVWSEPITVQQGASGPAAVPVPGALALLLSGVTGFVLSRRRRA